MRFWKCEFYEKWDFENLNFVKNEILKMWILRKVRFSKCEFLDELRIFAPVCPEKNLARFARFVFVVIVVWHVSFFIDTLCSHFANGKAHGNLCRQFCVTGDLQPKACQTFHAGKEVVFQATLENLPVSISQCTDWVFHNNRTIWEYFCTLSCGLGQYLSSKLRVLKILQLRDGWSYSIKIFAT